MLTFLQNWMTYLFNGLSFLRKENQGAGEHSQARVVKDENVEGHTVVLTSEMIRLLNQIIGFSIQLKDCRDELCVLHNKDTRCRKRSLKNEKLKGIIKVLRRYIKAPQAKLVSLWYHILEDQSLLDLPENIRESFGFQLGEDAPPLATGGSLIESEATQAMHDYATKKRLMFEAQEVFDSWGEYYQEQVETYEIWVRMGCDVTRSQFDLFCLLDKGDKTSALVSAEQAFEEAKQRVKELNVLVEDSDQESGFVDRDDGYTLSLERNTIKGFNRDYILNWLELQDHYPVKPETAAEILELPELDEWHGGSVEIFDSVSIKASHKQRARIDRWRSACESSALFGHGHDTGVRNRKI